MIDNNSPARERILSYLRQNRGREIPVSEIATQLDLKRTTISNAIKELSFQEYIAVERRPLKRGRYTVIYLTGDLIKDRYVHQNEIVKEIKAPHQVKKKQRSIDVPILDIESAINYLKSTEFNPEKYLIELNTRYPDSIGFTLDFITPLMHEVGVQWALTNLSTAEEHVISNRIEHLILSRIPKQNGNGGKGLVILVPVEGERHIIALLCLEHLLLDRDFKVINLGRALPIRSLIQYIKDLPKLPDWIFMSITLPAYLGTIKRNLEYMKSIFKNQIRIAIGGQGISEDERNSFPQADVIAINRDDTLKFFDQIR